ncbi:MULTISPECIES: FixH family protein [unclassified Polaribacter]|uniref:FixH family protein n=1 Tax=unclassified Polaribacter TaxID=196858 RepID=UPI0011BDA732|nr:MULTISPECIES: FixH family protein [unclassified Polaribacter]TXD51156.1 FixH family protein [Polaribacter sp. IC063]TXD56548.1 FixH family protein [Polaribacter sp. IC066]
MKIGWGTGIVITIIAFMAFILYFVVTMSTDKAFRYDLVVEDYYEQELKFQEEIDASQNLANLEEKLTIKRTEEGLQVQFPEKFLSKEIKGKMFLYRPSNKQLDFEIPILISNTYLLVPEKRLLDGRWNIKITWSYKNTNYLFKKELIY